MRKSVCLMKYFIVSGEKMKEKKLPKEFAMKPCSSKNRASQSSVKYMGDIKKKQKETFVIIVINNNLFLIKKRAC